MTAFDPTVDEVLEILEAGRDDDLKGVYESATRDFKGAYHFDDDRDRWEFGKDVAAMADGDGGVIVVGVHTEKDPTRDEEFAKAVKPFEHVRFDVERAYKFLDQDLYPPVEGVRIITFARGPDRRLVAIVVPSQLADRKPFLLSKVVDETGKSINAFVVPRRSGSHTVFEKVGMVHRDIADGRRHRRASGPETDEVSGGPAEHAPTDQASTSPVVPVDATDLRVAEQWLNDAADHLDRDHELQDTPMLYVAAVPAGARPRPSDFFTVDGMRTALSAARTLRHNGFGLTYGNNLRAAARSLLAVDEDRTLLRVDDDGHAINAAAGTHDHLAWAQTPSRAPGADRPALRINVIALSEFVYEFCRFIPRELAPRWGADRWMVAVAIRRAQSAGEPLALPPRWASNAWLSDARPAEADDRTEAFAATLDPGVDAVSVLRSIYSMFTVDVLLNPFVEGDRFDEAKLLAT